MEEASGGAQIAHGAGRVRAIVLIGVSGSGKTTIGKRLAPAIDATYLEGDNYHSSANIAKMRSGTALDDDDRKPWLEKIGRAIGDHCRGGRSVVVACSALRRCYRDILVGAARRELTFVLLTIPAAILEARIKARHQHFMPVSLLRSQLATLEPLADDEDGTEITETGTAQQTVVAVRRWMRRHAHGRLQRSGPHGRRGTLRYRRPLPHGQAPNVKTTPSTTT